MGDTRINMEEPVDGVIPPAERKKRKLQLSDTYAAKKTVAQGMMDIALITANANQLRYLIEYSKGSPTFEINVGLIIISLVLQVKALRISSITLQSNKLYLFIYAESFSFLNTLSGLQKNFILSISI